MVRRLFIALVCLLGVAPAATSADAAERTRPTERPVVLLRADRITACLTVGRRPVKTTTRVPFVDSTADSVTVDGKALKIGEPMAPGGFVMYGEGVVVRASQRGHRLTVRASSVLDHPARVCVRAHATTALDVVQGG